MKMHMSLVASLCVAGLLTSPASADSHGNEFVHSRTNNGQIYMMYQNHMSLYTH